jgi:hypothetical protein
MTLLRCGGRATEGSASARARIRQDYDWWVITDGADELEDESDEPEEPLEEEDPSDEPELVEPELLPPEDVLPDEVVLESDEVVPELDPVDPLSSLDPVDPLSSLDPSSQRLESPSIFELSDCDEPVLGDEGFELEDEAATLFFALALALPELDALRAGSWPLASVAKMTLHVAMNRATVSATALRRMRRTRARLAARRGFTSADMADTLDGHPKPRLSGP